MLRDKEEKDILKSFLKEEKARGRTEQGLSGLRSRVPRFFTFLDEEEGNIYQIGIKEAMAYQKWLLEHRKEDGQFYSARTVNSYLVAVTAFYEYLKRHDLVLNNPFKSIRRVRMEKTLPKNLIREKETDSLLDALSRFDEENHLKARIRRYRVHVLAEVLYSSGLRINEAAHIKMEDVELERGIIHIREGKGGKERICFLSSYAVSVLRIYIDEVRPMLLHGWHKGKDTLFLSCKDQLITLVSDTLIPLCKRQNLPPVTCHTFRHLLGYHLLRSGCSIRFIQSILGHEKLKNTEIYTKVDQEDLKSVLDSCHPRKWKRRAA